MNILYDLVGLVGVCFYVLGFYGIQMLVWDPKGYRYLFCNLLGALLSLISLYYAFNFASFVSQIVWLAISVISIFKTSQVQKINFNTTAHDNLYQ